LDTTFGTRLRDLRERRGISQRDLGIAAGISETYVQALEQGRRRRTRYAPSERTWSSTGCCEGASNATNSGMKPAPMM